MHYLSRTTLGTGLARTNSDAPPLSQHTGTTRAWTGAHWQGKELALRRPTVESRNLNSSFYFNSSFNQSRVLEHLQRRAHHHDQLAVRADGGLGLRTLALEGGD